MKIADEKCLKRKEMNMSHAVMILNKEWEYIKNEFKNFINKNPFTIWQRKDISYYTDSLEIYNRVEEKFKKEIIFWSV